MSGTPYLIAGNSGASGGSVTIEQTASSNVASGDTIWLAVLVSAAGVTVEVTDSQNNVYTQIEDDTTETSAQLYVFNCPEAIALVSGVDTITVTYSANTSVQAFIAVGDNNVTGPDKTIIAHGSGTSVSTGSSGTLSQAEEHAIFFICDAHAGGNPTYGSPWNANVLAIQGAGTTAILSAAYQDVTSTSGLTGTATITSAAWTAALITDTVNVVTFDMPNDLSDGVVGETYSQTLEATGGDGPYSYAITSGSLPAGLTLTSGVVSGTPSLAGTYNFTITITDADSSTATTDQTVVILPSSASGAAALDLPSNLLSAGDSDFEALDFTWASDVNAGDPVRSSHTSFTGDESLTWTATADGLTQIATDYYDVDPSKPYICSGVLLPSGPRDLFIGIKWYDDTDTLIETDLGPDNPSDGNNWQPLQAALTSPSNAAKAKIIVQVESANAGDRYFIDLMYLTQTNAQVVIDWSNNAFAAGGNAGQDFMDVSMFVRMDQGITIMRGRQDAISEIQPGSATLQLQNDTGVFTRFRNNTPISVLGGIVGLQRRCQINLADEAGVWYTRFDGPISEVDYQFDVTGNTSIASITVTDVMAFLNREDTLECWTKEQVLADAPALHWTLDDAGNAGGFGVAAETSGNNGPPMRLLNSDGTATATITWQDTSGGVETLADAVLPAQDDGSEYWATGVVTPNSQIRGLDSGTVGPYTTPLGSPYFVPKLAAASDYNQYISNTGYMLQAPIPGRMSPNITGNDYSIEIWFEMDPTIKTDIASKYGPYTLFSLGNSHDGLTLALALAPAGSPTADHLTLQLWTYAQPPGFIGKNFPGSPAVPTAIGTINDEISLDADKLPHHAVVTIQGDPSNPTVTCYLDGALFSASSSGTSIPAGAFFDTITAAGVFGGTGAFYGNLQLLSIYDYAMSGDQIVQHAQMGQYGMWEMPTDDCVAALATFANIPTFWNNVQGSHHGLTLTEYQDITGSNPLAMMQLYEQTEMGLLFVDAAGRLNFHTRDWRMGYGAPDLLLPPDTFDPDMGYELIDQFQINEQAVSSQTFPTGAGYVNTESQDEYGPYAVNGIGSPLQLPLLTWNRANSQLGLSSYFYWSDPYLDDYCAWQANSHADPWLVPGQLTVDLLTLNPNTGLAISDFYALEIDSMVAPTGVVPESFPDGQASVEWFIEGINETIMTSARNIQFYTSPAEAQRCWLPGDGTYGVLGQTTRIGVSATDTNQVQADGKDVSHDAGGPYWPPAFVNDTTLNDLTVFEDGDTTGWSCANGTLTTDHNGATYPVVTGSDVVVLPDAYSLVGTGTGGGEPQIQQDSEPFDAVPQGLYTVSALVYTPDAATVLIGTTWLDDTHTIISESFVEYGMTGGVWQELSNLASISPDGTAYGYVCVSSDTADGIVVAQNIRAVTGSSANEFMNNPAQNGHGFVGANDMRGLCSTLQAMLQPPLCVVGATGKTQSQTTGALTTPQIYWDNVYVDTEGGMGLVPGWPNWYVVTVAGWYEIDASVTWAISSWTEGDTAQAFIIVAQGAAQAAAAGTAGPTTVDQYVCPIGSAQRAPGTDTVTVVRNNPSTHMYLGIGDMVTIGAQHNHGSSVSTSTSGGSFMSLRFVGYGTVDDRVQVNTSLAGSGAVNNPPPPSSQKTTHTKVYNNTSTASYYANNSNSRKNTNGECFQGTAAGYFSVTGSECSLIFLPWQTIQSDLSAATITSITLKCTNQHFWYDAGGKLILGWSERTAAGGTFTPNSNDHMNVMQEAFSYGQTKTFSLPVSSFGSAIKSHAGCFVIGNHSTQNLQYYGFWKGGKSSWQLTVKYTT